MCLSAIGQHSCDFDANWCGYTLPEDNDLLRWKVKSGVVESRVPSADATSGSGRFFMVKANDQVRRFTPQGNCLFPRPESLKKQEVFRPPDNS